MEGAYKTMIVDPVKYSKEASKQYWLYRVEIIEYLIQMYFNGDKRAMDSLDLKRVAPHAEQVFIKGEYYGTLLIELSGSNIAFSFDAKDE